MCICKGSHFSDSIAETERMLKQDRFGIIVLLLLLDIFTSVKAGDCFVPDTTWAANTGQGIINVTKKVILFARPIVSFAVRFPEA